MTEFALAIDNAGKAYHEFRSEFRRFARWFGAGVRPDSEHWVVRHVSFRVEPGEAVGLIGQNGAGKSTLLKMIAGTTAPSEGSIRLAGRVSALLELGLGFNSELTGRENAIHSAGLMGISQAQIDLLMPEIESFAEIGQYFDQPMRTYSSGMQMRVAFSVATAVRPDILIVDEALAVGDAYFVHKCFQRIREFRDAGTTLILVSHDPGAVQSLCDRAILLDKGRMLLDGMPQEVLDYYNALLAEKESAGVRTNRTQGERVATESGSGAAYFTSIDLCDASGRSTEYVTVGQEVELRAEVRVGRDIPKLVFGYMIRDRLGQQIFGTNTAHTSQVAHDLREGDSLEFRVSFQANLGVGSYSFSLALTSTDTHLVDNYQWKDLVLVFTVANADKPTFVGCNWMEPTIAVCRPAASAPVTG